MDEETRYENVFSLHLSLVLLFFISSDHCIWFLAYKQAYNYSTWLSRTVWRNNNLGNKTKVGGVRITFWVQPLILLSFHSLQLLQVIKDHNQVITDHNQVIKDQKSVFIDQNLVTADYNRFTTHHNPFTSHHNLVNTDHNKVITNQNPIMQIITSSLHIITQSVHIIT